MVICLPLSMRLLTAPLTLPSSLFVLVSQAVFSTSSASLVQFCPAHVMIVSTDIPEVELVAFVAQLTSCDCRDRGHHSILVDASEVGVADHYRFCDVLFHLPDLLPFFLLRYLL